ncbi:MAG: hypothetical protein MZV63_32915 [Marinilabiliales bacterium]|nr:hypothetical protein [Marinilabiliales bacterium]
MPIYRGMLLSTIRTRSLTISAGIYSGMLKAVKSSDGWSAEIRIPLSSIRFQGKRWFPEDGPDYTEVDAGKE